MNLLKAGWMKSRPFVTVLAGIVLFTTVYTLILPAAATTPETATEDAGFYLNETTDNPADNTAEETAAGGETSSGAGAEAGTGGSAEATSETVDVSSFLEPEGSGDAPGAMLLTNNGDSTEDLANEGEGASAFGAPENSTDSSNDAAAGAAAAENEQTVTNDANAANAATEIQEDSKAVETAVTADTQESEAAEASANAATGSLENADSVEAGAANTTEAAEAPAEAPTATEEQHTEAQQAEVQNSEEELKAEESDVAEEAKAAEEEKQAEALAETKESEKDANAGEADTIALEEVKYTDSVKAENADGIRAEVTFAEAEKAGVREDSVLTVETVAEDDEVIKRIEDAMTSYVAKENEIKRDDVIVDEIKAVRLGLKNADDEDVDFEGEASVKVVYPGEVELEDDRFFVVYNDALEAVPAESYMESGNTVVSFKADELGLTGYFLAEEKIPVYESELSWESEDGALKVDVEFEEGAKIPENATLEVFVPEADENEDSEYSQLKNRVLDQLNEKLEKSVLESGEYEEDEELPWNELDYTKLLQIRIYDEEGNEVGPEDGSRMHVKVTLVRDAASFEMIEEGTKDLADIAEGAYGEDAEDAEDVEDRIEYRTIVIRDNKDYYDFVKAAKEENPDEEPEIPEDLYDLEEADTAFERLYDENGEYYALTADYYLEMTGFNGLFIDHVEYPIVYVHELAGTSEDGSFEMTVTLPEDAELEEGAALKLEQVFGNDYAEGSDRTWNETAKALIAEQYETDAENVDITFSRLYKFHMEDKDGNNVWFENTNADTRINRAVEETETTVIRFFRTQDAQLSADELSSVENDGTALSVNYQPQEGEIAGVMVFEVRKPEEETEEGSETEDADIEDIEVESEVITDESEEAGVSGNEDAEGGVSENADDATDATDAEITTPETVAETDLEKTGDSTAQDTASTENYMRGTLTQDGITLTFDVAAKIPEGTTLTVTPVEQAEEIENDEYYCRMRTALENDETGVLYGKVFKLALTKDDQKVIPEGKVTVTIHINDTVSGETGRAVLKYVDGVVERIAARDESAKPGFMESLVGTNGLNFTFDTFIGEELTVGVAVTGDPSESMFAAAAEKVNYAHELTGSADGVTVTATMGDDAGIVEGSTLSVRVIPEDSSEYKNLVRSYNRANPDKAIDTDPTAVEAVGNFFTGLFGAGKDEQTSFTKAKLVDITIISPDGTVIEPNDKVSVQIHFDEVIEASRKSDVSVIHFENKNTVTTLTEKEHSVEISASETGANSVNAEVSGDVNTDENMAGETAVLNAEAGTGEADHSVNQLMNAVSVDGVSFETSSFSVYGVVYSVDFTVVDPENIIEQVGETYTLQGGSSISLKELLVALNVTTAEEADEFINTAIASVSFTKPAAVKIEKAEEVVNAGFLGIGRQVSTNDFIITPMQLFEGDEYLVIERTDGQKAYIKLDAHGVEEVTTDIASISAADGRIMPADAVANAEIVTGNDAEAAKESVKNYVSEQKDNKGIIESFVSLFSANEDDDESNKAYKVFDISLENVAEENFEEGFKVELALPADVKGTDYALYHIHEDKIEELAVEVVDGKASFTTDGFSQFVLKYTVDFETPDGKVFSIPGEGSYKLNDLLPAIIGKEGVVSDASLKLIEGEEVEGALYLTQDENGDWYINSDVAFDDTYLLTIVVDGDTYEIRVTDVPLAGNTTQISATVSTGTSVSYDASESAYEANVTVKFVVPTDTIKREKTFTMQLGDDIIIPDNALNVTHTANDHGAAMDSFDYVFVKGADGKYSIEITYRDDYLNAVETIGKNTISFDVQIKESAMKDDGNIHTSITSGADITIPGTEITYPGNEDNKNNIFADKSYAGTGTTTDGKTYIDYTVRVSSTKGTKGNVELSDSLNLNYKINGADQPISVDSLTVQSITKSGSAYSGGTFTPSSDNKSFTYSLDRLGANEYYDITYRYVLNQKLQESGEPGKDFSMEASGGNSLTASSGGQETTDGDGFKIERSDKPVTIGKSGQYDGDGKIEWRIVVTVKPGSEHTLVDEMLINAQELTITKEGGSGGYTHTNGSNSITFNQPGTYTIVYKTDAEAIPYVDQKIKNTAIVDGNTNWKAEPEVTVPHNNDGQVTKSLTDEKIISTEGNIATYEFTWNVIFDLPQSGFPAGTVLKDQLRFDKSGSGQFYDKHEFTATQRAALISELEEIFGAGMFDVSLNASDYTLSITFKEDWSNTEGLSYANITYDTTGYVNLDEINIGLSTQTGKDKYVNTFRVGDVSASAEFTYQKEVNKIDETNRDGKNVTEHTVTRDNDVLKWAVVLALTDDYYTMEIEDTLPAGITPYEVSIGGEYNSDQWLIKEDGSGEFYRVESYNKYMKDAVKSITATKQPDGTTKLIVSIEVPHDNPETRPQYFKNGENFYTFIHAHVDASEFDPVANVTKTYTNNVSVVGDDFPVGEDDQTQITTLDSKSLDKSTDNSRWDNYHEIKYVVDINADGHAVMVDVEGKPIDGAVYSIDDVLQFNKTTPDGKDINIMLVPGSVELQTKSGSEWVKYTGDWSYQYIESKDGNKRFKTISLSGIPDQTPVRLVYAYKVDLDGVDPGDKTAHSLGPIINTVTIHGTHDYSYENVTNNKWSNFDTTASSESSNSLTLSKVDADNYDKLLPGAKFVLEYWDESTESWVAQDAISQETMYLTQDSPVTGITQVYVTATSTNPRAHGTLKIYQPYNTDYTGAKFAYNTCYRVREYSAPTGYMLSSDPEKQPAGYFWFSYEGSTKEDVDWPDDRIKNLSDDLSTESDTFYVNNAKQASLKINKKFAGDANLTEEQKASMTFEVYNDQNAKIATLSYADILQNRNVITNGIEEGKTYTVIEKVVEVSGAERVTTYTVNGGADIEGSSTGDVSAAVPVDNGIGSIVFTNSYHTPKTSIKVTKKWLNADGTPNTNPEKTTIKFQVYQLAEGASEGVPFVEEGNTEPTEYEITYTEGSWSEVTIDNLPKYADSVNQTGTYSYYVVETDPNTAIQTTYKVGEDGEEGTAQSASVQDETSEIVIVNKEVSISVTKKFVDNYGIEKTPSENQKIRFRVKGQHQYGSDTIFDNQEIVYSNGAWSSWSKKLPINANNGHPYIRYYIEEIEPNNYDVSFLIDGVAESETNQIRNDENQEITIVNSDKGQNGYIYLRKVWEDNDGESVEPESDTVSINVIQEPKTFEGQGNPATIHIEDMYGSGAQDITNYKIGDIVEITLNSGGWIGPSLSNCIILSESGYSYTLLLTEEMAKISVNGYGSITSVIHQKSSQTLPTEGESKVVTISGTEGWKYQNSLSTLFGDNWYLFDYRVEESNIPSGFAVTYTYGSTVDEDTMTGTISQGLVVVTNTKTVPQTGGFVVSKTVSGNAAGANASFDFSVTLSKNGLSGSQGGYQIGTESTVDSAASTPITFSDGAATVTFELKNGEVAKFINLPVDTAFTVTETVADQDGYETTVTKDGTVEADKVVDGTITASGSTTVAFTNKKETTSVEAIKAWKTGNQSINWPEDVASVTFALKAKVGNGDSKLISDDSISTFFTEVDATKLILSSADEKKATWENLPTRVLIPAVEATATTAAVPAHWEDVTYSVVETKVTYTEAAKAKAAEEGRTLSDLDTEEAIASKYSPTPWNQTEKTITNNIELIKVKVKKVWRDNNNAKGNRPENLTVTLSSGETVTLNDGNGWTDSILNLPKYDSEGRLIHYTWTEATIGNGYTLLGQSTEEIEEGGIETYFTTLTNGPDEHYNPETSFSGVKIWNDDGEHRPSKIIVVLYKGEGNNKTEVQRKEITGSGNDWSYEFTNIPVFDDQGNVIKYSVKEILPDGFEGQYLSTQDDVTPISYERDETKDKVTIVRPNNEYEISTGVNLGFVVIMHGNNFIIWTPRKPSDAEVALIKSKVHGVSTGNETFSQIESFTPLTEWGIPSDAIQKGNTKASIYMDGDKVMVDFGNKNWSSVAYGELGYTYTPGVMNLINTQIVTDFSFYKLWKSTDSSGYDQWKDGQQIKVTVSRRDASKTGKPVDSSFELKYTITKTDGTIITELTSYKPTSLGNAVTDSDDPDDPEKPENKFKLIVDSDTDNQYLFKIGEVLQRKGSNDEIWEYFVTEEQIQDYNAPAYAYKAGTTITTKLSGDDADKALRGEYIVNTPYDAVSLPETGGVGTTIYTVFGSTILALSVLAYIFKRRLGYQL